MPNPNNFGKVRALAATLRLPNLPSVWSNTLSGAILALLIIDAQDLSKLPLALLIPTSLYFAGNLLNDWADRAWDARNRPERALPVGLFKPGQYLIAAILLIVVGLGTAITAGIPSLVTSACLTACILIYTWSHKKTAWSVIPMAACRALLPVLGYCVCTSEIDKLEWTALPAGLLFIYLILLTLRARAESTKHENRQQSILSSAAFVIPPVIVAAYWFFPHLWLDALLVCILSSIPYLVWMTLTLTRLRKPIPRQVSAMLAGIALIDGLFLLPYFIMGFIHTPNPLTTAVCFFWVLAFITGRLLQRYVSAT
jgi:hypothetical protein